VQNTHTVLGKPMISYIQCIEYNYGIKHTLSCIGIVVNLLLVSEINSQNMTQMTYITLCSSITWTTNRRGGVLRNWQNVNA